MKSVGLNLILAQIGYFVAAKNYNFYPYNSIFTRICGNDDIYRGLSSFMVEMIELMSILKRNNKRKIIYIIIISNPIKFDSFPLLKD